MPILLCSLQSSGWVLPSQRGISTDLKCSSAKLGSSWRLVQNGHLKDEALGIAPHMGGDSRFVVLVSIWDAVLHERSPVLFAFWE